MWRLLVPAGLACLGGVILGGCSTAQSDDTSERAEGTDPSQAAQCPGDVPEEGCRSNEDCTVEEVCRAPVTTPVPVPVVVPLVPCSDDSTCPTDQSCNGTYCLLPHCSSGYACSADETCDRTAFANPNHGCKPIPCSEPSGPPCPWWQQCSSERKACVDVPCAADRDCGCGVCTWFGLTKSAQGYCSPEPGYCALPDPPVPPG